MKKIELTALVITKNEEAAIGRCLNALDFCDQIIVVDSLSTDNTKMIARSLGATVVDFVWNGEYPKKKQWAMSHHLVRNNWVLHVDGDEIVSRELAREITQRIKHSTEAHSAYDLPISYHFMGKRLRYGHTVHKRSLVDRRRARFPEVGDLGAPGITEVEGHYQPEVNGTVGVLRSRLTHDDPDPLREWIARHNRYSDWEAYLVLHPETATRVRQRRTAGGRLFDSVPCKPVAFFIYAFILRLGFLDGRAGLDYALSLSWYYWAIGAKVRDESRRRFSH